MALYLLLAVVDFWLMRRYARLDPPERGADGEGGAPAADAGAELLMQTTWFWILCALWSLYFVSEGFDFGVGMLLPVLGRSEEDRRTMIGAIGPHWDGNEVWLIIAGAATFAAFPVWYATMFSGFYIALLLVLVLLIVRVVSFEWRGKAESAGWRAVWTWLNTTAAVGLPLLWGIALSSLLHGVPISSEQEFTGTFWDLFTPYTVIAGIAFVLLFAFHGAVYLTLRTTGDLHARTVRTAARLALPAAAVGAAFLIWTLVVGVQVNDQGIFPGIVLVAARRGGRGRRGRAHVPAPRGPRVRRHRSDDRARRRAPLHRALPAGDGLLDRLRRQPHDLELLVGPLHPDRAEHHHPDPAPGHPALPGVELPRLPRPARPRRARGQPNRPPGGEA